MELVQCVIVAVVFLGCAAAGMVWHVRAWRACQASSVDVKEREFRRRQFYRRMQTMALAGLVLAALPIGLWILPQWPKVGVAFWGVVVLLVGWIAILGMAEIWAAKYYFGRVQDAYRIEQARLQGELRLAQAELRAERRRTPEGLGNGKERGPRPATGPGAPGQGPDIQ